MKTCIIRQPAGLGDILFSQKIAYKIKEKYNPDKIIWPVCRQYEFVRDYLELKTEVEFPVETNNFNFKQVFETGGKNIIINDELIYIPLQFSCEVTDGGDYTQNLYSKYKFVNLKFDDWKNYISLKRNIEREEKLKDFLNIGKDDEFVLLNKNYGTVHQTRNDLSIDTPYRIVEMEYVTGYHIFDWIGIMLQAKHIYTLETSLTYIADLLNLDNVNVYYRAIDIQHIENSVFHSFEYCRKIYNNKNWRWEDE